MLDTNHCLSFEPSPPGSPPIGEDMEKAGMMMDHDRHVYLNLKEGGHFGSQSDTWYDLCLQVHVSSLLMMHDFVKIRWSGYMFSLINPISRIDQIWREIKDGEVQ